MLKLSSSLKIAYEDMGSGSKCLVFIHGLSSTKSIWHKNIPALAKQYRCISIDLPGYGKSSKTELDYSLFHYSQVLTAFLEKLGLTKVILIGHSMGAQISIIHALKHPELLAKLVLIAPAGIETFTKEEGEWLNNLYQPDILSQLSVEQFMNTVKAGFYHWSQAEDPLLEDYRNLHHLSDFSQFCKTISANVKSMLDESVFHQLGDLDMPVLIIFGERDQMIPNRFIHPRSSTLTIARQAHARIKKSQLSIIPEAGHFVHWEQADKVNLEIINFIS